MSKFTQASRVLNYMNTFGPISRVEALLDLGIANLPAVIAEMRGAGYGIRTMIVQSTNRYGEPVRYAKYSLIKENNEDGSKEFSR